MINDRFHFCTYGYVHTLHLNQLHIPHKRLSMHASSVYASASDSRDLSRFKFGYPCVDFWLYSIIIDISSLIAIRSVIAKIDKLVQTKSYPSLPSSSSGIGEKSKTYVQ